MNEYYSLAEAVSITGLTDRTLRSYISQNMLTGEKHNGAWRFTAEQLCSFMNDPNVLPGIRAKKNAIVFDFLAEKRRSIREACLVLDLPGCDFEAVPAFFCSAINSGAYGDIVFSFDSLGGQTPRVILKGETDAVLALVERFRAEC